MNIVVLFSCTAEREAVNAAERAEKKLQLRDKVSSSFLFPFLVYQLLLRRKGASCRTIPCLLAPDYTLL